MYIVHTGISYILKNEYSYINCEYHGHIVMNTCPMEFHGIEARQSKQTEIVWFIVKQDPAIPSQKGLLDP